MKQNNFKAVEFMRKRRGELSKLYFINKTEFIDKINNNSINLKKKLKLSSFSKKIKYLKVLKNEVSKIIVTKINLGSCIF